MTGADAVIFDNARRLVEPTVLSTIRQDIVSPLPVSGPGIPSGRHNSNGSGNSGLTHRAAADNEKAASIPGAESNIPGNEYNSVEQALSHDPQPLTVASGLPALASLVPGGVTAGLPSAMQGIKTTSGLGSTDRDVPLNDSNNPTNDSQKVSRGTRSTSESLMPASGIAPPVNPRHTRERRGKHREKWTIPHGGPSIIRPQPSDLIAQHLPGPGVIGIDL